MKDLALIKPSNTDRRAVRVMARAARKATLATTMAGTGHPYASLVTVATDHAGSPLLLLSTLAEHTRGLLADSRAALFLEDGEGESDPQANPQEAARVTLLGRVERHDDALDLGRFLARHPKAARYASFGDFGLYRLTIERAQYVAGFGRALWIDEGLTVPVSAAAALRAESPALIAEMNADHADALARLAEAALTGRQAPLNPTDERQAKGWRLVACDTDGCDLLRGDQPLRLTFPAPAGDARSAKETLLQWDAALRAENAPNPGFGGRD
ncbi:pyridoxamine 5'-phosphate oxidase-related, FMN-binding protein [Rhodospirillum rubrum F11]|uniref:Pyridoxamine 5'-phosphate oxidase-related, FMN-binding n=2 Tax=Rhodospirillum rubrum TaxID=1085 RepID=Q2RNT1_RHORT|nr:DUF2470 domain-containing protein [Rhodospirillum rubrum]ABC24214.1 Pyridoxamine 5'-phosphate oxidase-related, FMN-binding [Rhodospirillum rubrum ATCC 11170]AEO49965.1 pyridoxamine 5'-phosphate oxidase-related, FMN-binding protein [Rhodospirillum rubrum F11]MBK5955932.1 pyridoxamine 5'-phosphate oxidase [Rhodospirillum rubrum]QXG80149.1 DUF2470 domain-containing protein [Rhodospirillum rubrum]HAP99211.1 pyridoxamine 5'-phosphate oxidase [Rhodospirillum rubrum]